MLLGEESWRLLLQVRNDEAKADIPLVVMSSSGEERKAVHLGADEYLAKPIDGEVLLGLLDRLTGRQSITSVLLVDDEEIARYLVRQLLPRSRYSLLTVNNGKTGLARLQRTAARRGPAGHQHAGNERLRVSGAHERNIPSFAAIPAIVLTSAILEPHERSLLQRASMVMSKSSLSSTTLIDAIQGVAAPREPMLIGMTKRRAPGSSSSMTMMAADT